MNHQPRSIVTLIFALAGLVSSGFSQEAAPEGRGEAFVPEWQMEFENLHPEVRRKYLETVSDAAVLFNQKRIFESLNRIAEADVIFENNPAALNLKGACYVEFRDFGKARECFDRALELQKEVLVGVDKLTPEERRKRLSSVANVLFNIAEMDFVTEQWESAATRFDELIPDLDPNRTSMIRLIEFKILLCKLKSGKIEEARTLADKHDYLDDSPYHYYGHAALAYEEGDPEAAERLRATARRVFRTAQILSPWEDTMIEVGYVKSFYGGDLEAGDPAGE
jgi:tetratricopeptide (TPR) repeat protein